MLQPILTDDYNYDLPEGRIAKFPLPERDHSKLLIYRQGQITEDHFYHLGQQIGHIGQDYLLVRNNTKVIPARLKYKKETGGEIEIFCLLPLEPFTDIGLALQASSEVVWSAMVGHQKKWRKGESLTFQSGNLTLTAELLERGETAKVKFSWQPSELTFAEVIEQLGHIPIPPYLNRSAEQSDRDRYQTIYAETEGSVAAPTAGLHFTERVIEDLKQNHISFADLTLHVGAGTFKPVTETDATRHAMHSEPFYFDKKTIQQLKDHFPKIIAVGTTSLRSLESLYWLGVARVKGLHLDDEELPQFFPYEHQDSALPSPIEVFDYFLKENDFPVQASTRLMIVPGYQFQVCKGIITNFHQPGSTLLLLISAITGDDWKRIYDYALQNDFRFLSYGDSSLLWMV